MPVARKFDPNLVMVSAGFDAAVGDPLGGCYVTPRGYGVMLKKLMELADGRLVMALEGGYKIKSLEESSLACVKVLLGDTVLSSFEERPLDSTHQLINLVRKNLCGFWPVLADSAPGIQFQELHGNAVLNADRSFVDEYETSSDVLNEVVAQTAKAWSEVEEAMQSHPIPGFGKKLSSILDTCLSEYDAEATYFQEGVRSTKRKQLEEKLLQLVQPAYQSMLGHIRSRTLDKFKDAFDNALKGGHQHVESVIWDDLIAHFVRMAILCSRGKELVEQERANKQEQETEQKLATKKKAVKNQPKPNTLPNQPRGFRIRKVSVKLKDYTV